MSNYIAIAAKVKGLYGKRLKSLDYDAVMQMQTVPQIAQYLRSHAGYAEQLLPLDSLDISRGMLESTISQVSFVDFEKLNFFLSSKDRKLFLMLVLQMEMLQILFYVRRLKAGYFEKSPLTYPSKVQGKIHLELSRLMTARTAEALCAAAAGSVFSSILRRFLLEQPEGFTFTALELAMQSLYYTLLYRRIERGYVGKLKKSLKEAFGRQLDLTNIARIVRLRLYFSDQPDALFGHMIPMTYKVKPDFLRSLMTATDDAAVRALLLSSPYKSLYETYDFDMIEQYSREAQHDFYKQVLQSAQPSVLHVLAYFRFKETEVKNLINLVECVKYNIPKEQMHKYLVGVFKD